MQSRTELSHSRIIHRQNLPRGYFKKRKHESEDARPPDIAKIPFRQNTFSVNYLNCVNTKNLKFMIVLILWMVTTIRHANATTIEPDLKVLSLERTATPLPSLTNENGSGSEYCFTKMCC